MPVLESPNLKRFAEHVFEKGHCDCNILFQLERICVYTLAQPPCSAGALSTAGVSRWSMEGGGRTDPSVQAGSSATAICSEKSEATDREMWF